MKRVKSAPATANSKRAKAGDDDEFSEGGGMKDLFGRPLPSAGTWSVPHPDVMEFKANGVVGREKIAAFDMDGTLISTKSGHVFPKDTTDWKWLNDAVVPKLKKIHNEENFKIVIFTNQKGIKIKKVDAGMFKKKIEAIVKSAGVPIHVFISLGDARYRKPMTGMWELLKSHNDGVAIDMKASVFVGDAAGRHKTVARPRKDHSCADRLFAKNIGLPFETPEQFFDGKKAEEPWGPVPFCPHEMKTKQQTLLDPPDTRVPSTEKEIIVMVGFPGSGKSSFAKRLAEKHGYVVVNRDTLGTWQKCVAAARDALREGKSVVVDNTNPDKESRKRYVMLAAELGERIPVRCFEMTSTVHHATHNVKYRQMTRGGEDVSSMVLRMHASKYEKPTLAEGFTEIVQVNFVPEFDSEDDEKLYFQYLVE